MENSPYLNRRRRSVAEAERDILIDHCHRALRLVDAGDTSSPIPVKHLDVVSDVVLELEDFARAHAIALSEFAR